MFIRKDYGRTTFSIFQNTYSIDEQVLPYV